jgi:hypothetical protein
VKLALVATELTLTVGGTVSAAVLLVSATVPPPTFERVTMQVLAAPGAIVEGVQVRALTVAATVSENDTL